MPKYGLHPLRSGIMEEVSRFFCLGPGQTLVHRQEEDFVHVFSDLCVTVCRFSLAGEDVVATSRSEGQRLPLLLRSVFSVMLLQRISWGLFWRCQGMEMASHALASPWLSDGTHLLELLSK